MPDVGLYLSVLLNLDYVVAALMLLEFEVLSLHLWIMNSICMFIEISGLQMTFARYAERTAFERPLTSGVAYAVKVLHSEREHFEKRQGWTIKKMESQKQTPAREGDAAFEAHETSPVEEEYAPVIFAQETLSHVISLDMLSGKVKSFP